MKQVKILRNAELGSTTKIIPINWLVIAPRICYFYFLIFLNTAPVSARYINGPLRSVVAKLLRISVESKKKKSSEIKKSCVKLQNILQRRPIMSICLKLLLMFTLFFVREVFSHDLREYYLFFFLVNKQQYLNCLNFEVLGTGWNWFEILNRDGLRCCLRKLILILPSRPRKNRNAMWFIALRKFVNKYIFKLFSFIICV